MFDRVRQSDPAGRVESAGGADLAERADPASRTNSAGPANSAGRARPAVPVYVTWIIAVLMILVYPMTGCDLIGGRNPTPGAKAVRFGNVWVRHLIDKHDRESTAVVGFTLKDAASKSIAADGNLEVELKWGQGQMEWLAKGSAEVQASKFREAKSKPVKDGTLYTEPWNIYMIGPQYPGPSKYGYYTQLIFTSKDGDKIKFHRRLPVSR